MALCAGYTLPASEGKCRYALDGFMQAVALHLPKLSALRVGAILPPWLQASICLHVHTAITTFTCTFLG